MLCAPGATMVDGMNLIEVLERLGIAGHFEREIEEKLEHFFNLKADYKDEMWWKDLDLLSKLPYARDRLVECYFWANAAYYEPEYSRGRVMLTKVIIITSLVDDTYDSYGTAEELEIFTQVIERWDVDELNRLPEYMRALYITLLELYEGFEEELSNEGRSNVVSYAIQAMKDLTKSYYIEAKWFIEGYLPPFAEYMDNALTTCTNYYILVGCLLGMDSARQEEAEFLYKRPKVLVANAIKCRLIDDISTYETRKERGQITTGLECYMTEYGVTKEESIAKMVEMVGNAWKDTNEELLTQYHRYVLMRILNLDRVLEVTYKNNEDGYTKPGGAMKSHITHLFLDLMDLN